jgi:glycosyltransferase involved in cell wall biosynthesis
MGASNHIILNKDFPLETTKIESILNYPGLNKRTIRHLSIDSLFPYDPTLKDGVIKHANNNGFIDIEVISTSCAEIEQGDSFLNYVSIVMPTHNTKKYIEATLESISEQDYIPFELIIVDDGSIDGTVDIVKDFLCSRHDTLRARFVSLPNFGSPSVIRNFALYNLVSKHASYITYMDDDDIYANNHSLSSLVQPLIGDSKYICTYGGFDFIDEDGVLITGPSMLKKKSGAWEWRKEARLSWFNIATRRTGVYHLQSLCVRAPSPIMPYYKTGSDAGYFARVINRVSASCSGSLNGIFHVPGVIFHYRKRKNSISTKKHKSHRRLNSATIEINKERVIPKFYVECGMPEKYFTQENITEFEIRKRIPHIYNALYLFHMRDLMGLIKDVRDELGISTPYLLAIITKEFILNSKIRDFVLFKIKRLF